MNKTTLVTYLGRPLTSLEDTSFTPYLDIAMENLERLLCTPIIQEDEVTRKFASRDGYRSVFVGVIRAVSEVKIDGIVTTNYTLMQFDSLNGDWFNVIVFDSEPCGVIEVTGDWGFCPLPNDLRLLVANYLASSVKVRRWMHE